MRSGMLFPADFTSQIDELADLITCQKLIEGFNLLLTLVLCGGELRTFFLHLATNESGHPFCEPWPNPQQRAMRCGLPLSVLRRAWTPTRWLFGQGLPWAMFYQRLI